MDHHIYPLYLLLTAASQDHSGFTGVLSNVTTRLYSAEALHPVIAAQRKEDSGDAGMGPPSPDITTGHPESKRVRWPCHTIITGTVHTVVPNLAQCNSAPRILLSRLCMSQYLPTNPLLPRIYYRDTSWRSPIPILPRDYPPSSLPHYWPAHQTCSNTQHCAMQVQVLLAMEKYLLYKDKSRDLL